VYTFNTYLVYTYYGEKAERMDKYAIELARSLNLSANRYILLLVHVIYHTQKSMSSIKYEAFPFNVFLLSLGWYHDIESYLMVCV